MIQTYSYKSKNIGSSLIVRENIQGVSTVNDNNWELNDIIYTETEPTIEQLKNVKLTELDNTFYTYYNARSTYLTSSLGFKINANQDAFVNVSGLVVQMESLDDNATIAFTDFDDSIHQLNKSQVAIIHDEISKAGSLAYTQKWKYRNEINECLDIEKLKAMEFSFEPVSFIH